jgi:quercetin dioxygenase-like cupin family protein
MSEEAGRQALRPSVGGMLSFNLVEEAARLKAKPEWSTRDRLAVSLVKDDALNLMLMALKQGARLEEHRAKGPISVQLLAGRIRFGAAGEKVELSPGNVIALDREIPHELEALDESIVLLTTSIG